MSQALITNDAVIFGLLAASVAAVFYTRSRGRGWSRFYTYVPPILMCYLLPALMRSTNLIAYEGSSLWPMAKNYLLPASLILMTLSIDLKAILGLGPKALIMFGTATVGVIIGGPLALLTVASINPEVVGGTDSGAIWRGLATLAGSWIGGGANQTAMLEIYGFDQSRYGAMVAVDIIVANLWMAVLLYGAGRSDKVDQWLGADNAPIERLKQQMSAYSDSIRRTATLEDLLLIAAVAFGGVGIAHLFADIAVSQFALVDALQDTIFTSKFFWVVVVATTFGLGLSFTRMRGLEGAGASMVGSVFIYLMVAIIGTKMDLGAIADIPWLFVVGVLWMLFHVTLLVVVARVIRAPFFLIAVGSKANIGGAASAPIVAAAFHPSLAPVGVLLAVLGYALGTYGAIFCAELMRLAAP